MANKLKIYACSGIGKSYEPNKLLENMHFYTDDTNTLTNTQAVNTLLVNINYANAQLNAVDVTEEEAIRLCNEIDLYAVCLALVREYQGDPDKLKSVGNAISNSVEAGDFNFNSLDDDKREAHIESVFTDIQTKIGSPSMRENDEFNAWWQKNILNRNKVYLSSRQAQEVEQTINKAVSGIGVNPEWMQNAELSDMLLKGSEYFLYLYFTDDEIKKLPEVFKKKRSDQTKTYYYCRDLFEVYGSKEEMDKIIASGIYNYFGDSPRNVCKSIVNSKNPQDPLKGVGLAAEIISAIISAVVTVVCALISAICSCVARIKEAKYQAITAEAIEDSVPEESDFFKNNKSLIIGTIAVMLGLWWIMRK